MYTLSQHIQFLCRLPPHVRVEHLVATDLKPAAKRKARACADPDDFVLGNAEWEYMSKVDWSRTLDIAYHLYCVQQVVSLWGNRCSIDISVALLQWAIMATTGNTMPLTVWSTELAVRYRGSEVITARRREEMKDILIGWSTSFPETGLPVPILPAPKRGTMGNGITGYGSDKRRPIPENVMAIAAAPVIAENWRHIMDVRLQTRTRALPLDEEFTMAARMFADAYSEHFKATKNRQLATRLKAKQDAKDDKLATKVAKREAEAAAKSAKSAAREARRVAKSAPGSRRGSRPPSQPVDPAGRSKSQPLDPKEPQSSVNLETLLATMEDSSDDDAGNDSEDDGDMPSSSRPLDIENLGAGEAAVPFGFSIGPDGFSVATSDSKPATTVSVGPPLTQSLRAQQKRPFSQMSAISEAASSKRRKVRQRPAAPPSPPSTGGSTPAGRSPSPSPSLASIRSLRLVSPTPSLRAVSMSPSLSSMPLQPVDGLPNTAHIGRLIRERQQYAYYNAYNDQRSGKIVSPEVERAMNAWVATKKAEGVVPEKITRQYLADQLDFHGDPKTDDLGPFIQAHPQWSPTECLLRLGVRPIEFPTHHVPHSLLDLEQQLGHFKWSDRLGPEDEPLSTAELDRELDTLFSLGDESWRGLLATPAEAARREKAYLKSGAWSYGRDIPEGSRRRLDQGKGKSDGKARNRESVLGGKMSKRINYGALERLVAQPVAGSDVGDNDEDEEADDEVIGELVHETLWDALGTATSRVEDDGDDDGDDGENDDEGEDDDDNDNDNNDIDQ